MESGVAISLENSYLVLMRYHYIFGPVASGRLGRSLGLDLLGAKICSLNCLYCEVGPTKVLTLERCPWVPAINILDELVRWRRESNFSLDVVTLGGSGEPCLNSDLGAIIAGVRELFPGLPVALLTNAVHLYDPKVAAEAATADVVLPSLDSLDPEVYVRLNRPHFELAAQGPAAIAAGIQSFRQIFDGRLYLEVLLVRGINDSQAGREALAVFCRELRADRVDVVTLTRPGTSPLAEAVSADTLAVWRAVLSVASGSVIAPFRSGLNYQISHSEYLDNLGETVYASLQRRPQTAGQLAAALAVAEDILAGVLERLLCQGYIERVESGGLIFHRVAELP
ncbi:conserved hypothetical protein [Desulfovibrionales bacterium]